MHLIRKILLIPPQFFSLLSTVYSSAISACCAVSAANKRFSYAIGQKQGQCSIHTVHSEQTNWQTDTRTDKQTARYAGSASFCSDENAIIVLFAGYHFVCCNWQQLATAQTHTHTLWKTHSHTRQYNYRDRAALVAVYWFNDWICVNLFKVQKFAVEMLEVLATFSHSTTTCST